MGYYVIISIYLLQVIDQNVKILIEIAFPFKSKTSTSNTSNLLGNNVSIDFDTDEETGQ